MPYSLQPHGLKHTRVTCPLLSPRVCSNSCLLSQCSLSPNHPTQGQVHFQSHFHCSNHEMPQKITCFPSKADVLVYAGCHTKHHRLDDLNLFLTVLEARSLRSRCQQVWFLPKPLSLASRWPSSPCVFT